MKRCVYCKRIVWFWQQQYSLHGYVGEPEAKRYWRHTKCANKALTS